MKTIIAPSLLSADFTNLDSEITKMENAGADWLHFDVMDGHFVPNISFGVPVLKSIKGKFNLINDVHIMISDPYFYASKFIKAGAQILTFHYEACKNDNDVFRTIDLIHSYGAKAGLSIKPGTPIFKIFPFLYSLDLVLIMSVEPGFGGQAFIEDSIDKIAILSKKIKQNNIKCLIEVDGGINGETGKKCVEAGANILVAGSYLFGHDDVEERINKLKL
ncbi:MAG: ribulose-phosphate 3-epimerase [Bacilli bacterium]|nr:ribulose-phosphate 3-epimerase [Bacilli bacterium]